MTHIEPLYFCNMSGGEILVILVIYLLLFGAKGIPTLAQTLGKALYQFRNAARDVQSEILQSADDIRKQANIRLDQIDIDEPNLRNEPRIHNPPAPQIRTDAPAEPAPEPRKPE